MLLGKFTYTNISVFMMPKNVGPYSDAFCNEKRFRFTLGQTKAATPAVQNMFFMSR